MAHIGTFTQAKHGYSGTLHTLTLNLEVNLVENGQSGRGGPGGSSNAPDFHLQNLEGTEIGAAWHKVSKGGDGSTGRTVSSNAGAKAGKGGAASRAAGKPGAGAQGGRPYLSVVVDDPSFASPIYARLIEGDDGRHWLYWSRSQRD